MTISGWGGGDKVVAEGYGFECRNCRCNYFRFVEQSKNFSLFLPVS